MISKNAIITLSKRKLKVEFHRCRNGREVDMRRPIPRIKGKYNFDEGTEIGDFAEKVANDLCDKFSDFDIVDLENIFIRNFCFHMARRLAKESISD